MDKKTLLIIFTFVSLVIVAGFIYSKYKTLTNQIAQLKAELAVGGGGDSNIENLSNNSFINTPEVSPDDRANINMSDILLDSTNSVDGDSIIRARNELSLLQQELHNVEDLIQDSDTESAQNYSNDIGAAHPNDTGAAHPNDIGVTHHKDTGAAHPNDTGAAHPNDIGAAHPKDALLDNSAEYTSALNPLHTNKNNISEFEDLANVPSDDNSELNQLIHKESQILDTISPYNISTTDNASAHNTSSFHNMSSHHLQDDYVSEISQNIVMKSADDKESVKKTIKIDLIVKNFSNKQLKDICRDHYMAIGGAKIKLINRIIENGFGHLLNNSPAELNLTELSQ
jgi:hypothetical protein